MSLETSNATLEELSELYTGKYQSKNPLLQWLLNRFFKTIERIVSTLGPDDRLLEIGCGAGESSLRIMKMLSGQHLEVSEYEEQLVQMLRQTNFPLKITQESIYALKRKDKEFDCVFLLEVLEHLDDYRRALKEIFRVSKKTVVISVPNEPLWRIENLLRGKYLKDWGNTPGHINHWNRHSLVRLVGEFGVVKRVYTPFPWIVVQVEVHKSRPMGISVGEITER